MSRVTFCFGRFRLDALDMGDRFEQNEEGPSEKGKGRPQGHE